MSPAITNLPPGTRSAEDVLHSIRAMIEADMNECKRQAESYEYKYRYLEAVLSSVTQEMSLIGAWK
jgi:hypothetical protein